MRGPAQERKSSFSGRIRTGSNQLLPAPLASTPSHNNIPFLSLVAPLGQCYRPIITEDPLAGLHLHATVPKTCKDSEMQPAFIQTLSVRTSTATHLPTHPREPQQPIGGCAPKMPAALLHTMRQEAPFSSPFVPPTSSTSTLNTGRGEAEKGRDGGRAERSGLGHHRWC